MTKDNYEKRVSKEGGNGSQEDKDSLQVAPQKELPMQWTVLRQLGTYVLYEYYYGILSSNSFGLSWDALLVWSTQALKIYPHKSKMTIHC